MEQKSRNRIFVFVAWLFVGSVIFVGFLAQPAFAEKKPVIAYLLPNVGPWYTDKWYGIKDEAQKLGMDAIMLNAGGYQNIGRQIAQFEDMIQKKVDGIILHPTSGTALIPSVKKALKAGIPVSTEHAPLAERIVPHIWEDPPRLGWQAGQKAADDLNGKGKIIAHAGPPGQYEAMAMYDSFKAYLRYFPEIEIVATEWKNINIADAMKTTEDLLTAHPDTDGIYVFAHLDGVGAANALQGRGYKPGQVKIWVGWANPMVLKYLRGGWITDVWPGGAVEVGRTSVRNMYKMIKGEKVPMITDVPMIGINQGSIDRWDRSEYIAPAK